MHVDYQAIVGTGKKVQMRLSHLRARILARKHSLTRVASGDVISGRTAVIFELEILVMKLSSFELNAFALKFYHTGYRAN